MAVKTRQQSSPVRKRKPRRRLTADDCPICGTPMLKRVTTLGFPVNGEEMSVPKVSHLRCPKCHEVVLTLDEADAMRQRAYSLYRARYHLLSADEIRAIRERHRLTQAELARLLRFGANTISRWESGRIVQTAAMDILLRLVRDIPASLRYLKKHAA